MMITKKKSDKCMTHYYGCDCNRYRFEQMERSLKILRTWASFEVENGILAATSQEKLDLCRKALGGDK